MLTLIKIFDQISENELCHFDIVRENINWKMCAFSNGNEFSAWIVIFS